MKHKILLVFLVFTTLKIMTACCEPEYFEWAEISSEFRSASQNQSLVPTDTITADDLLIKVTFTPAITAWIQKSMIASTAYASDCAPELPNNMKFKDLTLKLKYDYNQQYQAGDDISDLMEASVADVESNSPALSMDQMIEALNRDRDHGISEEVYHLQLTESPANLIPFSLQFDFKLFDDHVISIESGLIFIQ